MSIVDGSGKPVAEYSYDPYGNVPTATGTLAEINPLRYRGYYYDTETQLFYLQSRYYDPRMCRFINADAYASTGQGLLGNNMFGYCLNNPVNLSDYSGALPSYAFLGDNHIFSDKILTGGGGGGITSSSRTASAAVIANEKEFINNTSEQVVLEAEDIAFYKGAVVIKVPGMKNSGFTFGAIFVGEDANANLIRHEYGHIVQLQETDVMTYTAYMVMPSVVCYGLSQTGVLSWNDYYDRPWEYLADQFGGVSRNHAPWAASVAEIYWRIAKTVSLLY